MNLVRHVDAALIVPVFIWPAHRTLASVAHSTLVSLRLSGGVW